MTFLQKLTLLLPCLVAGLAAFPQATPSGKRPTSGSTIALPNQLLDHHKAVANWIWDSGAVNPRNYHLMVRKTIRLDQEPAAVTAFISAFASADVFVNGKLVDRCPMNCDPEYQVYEKYDLTGYFRKGKNVITALVYNFGTGMHHRLNGRGGFFFQSLLSMGDANPIMINSDQTWKVTRADAWDSSTGTRTATSNLIGFIEKFDAVRMPEHWMESGFDDSGWENAHSIGIPPVAPWNQIVEIDRPPLFREVVRPVRHWTNDDKEVYDFGTELAGNPVVEISALNSGIALEMGTGERLLPDSTVLYTKRVNYTDYYSTRKGSQIWSPMTWRGFRYLSLSRKDGVNFESVSALSRHYDLSRQGSFGCSDSLMNRIWEVGNQTILLCAQDTYMDTPWREQTQYIAGDTRFLQKYAFYPFGMSSELLIRYNILSGAWSQRWKTDGSIRSRYPTDWLLEGNTSAYLADYELEWVIMLGEYYRYFGKGDLIRQVYPNLKKLLVSFEKYMGKEHGLLTKVPGWIVLDHPDTYPMDQTDEITGLNCLYYAALREAASLAKEVASDPGQSLAWYKKADQLKMNINQWLQSPSTKLYADSYGSLKFSQQTQVYALLYGLADKQDEDLIAKAIAASGRSSEESFSYYLVYAMWGHNPQWAIDFIRTNWGGQMKAPFFNGAWHEAWDIANWTTDLGTTSHAWCSGPTALLPQKVLGLEPISAGWKLFSVRPEWCGLSWAKGDVNTPYGKIAVAWNRDSQGKLQLSFNVPVGCKALVEMQVSSSKDYTINGVPAQTCPGIGSFRAEKGKLLFDASPGKYRFQTVD